MRLCACSDADSARSFERDDALMGDKRRATPTFEEEEEEEDVDDGVDGGDARDPVDSRNDDELFRVRATPTADGIDAIDSSRFRVDAVDGDVDEVGRPSG
jgi:hypothetical protein